MKYYMINVFIGRREGYSAVIIIEDGNPTDRMSIAIEAVNRGIIDSDDVLYISCINEIDISEYERFNKI